MRTVPAIVAGALGILLATEVVLRVLPVSTATMQGYYFDPDLYTYPAHHEWTFSTGWDLRNPQRLRSNNWGFAAHRDFETGRAALALVGDSYIESATLEYDQRPGPQLERALGGVRPVYAMGSPGTALLDYAQRVRFAAERFGITDFVIWLERGDARQTLCGSGNVHSRCLDRATLEPRIERLPAATWAKRVARHFALAQYFAGQVRFQPEHFAEQMLTRQTPTPAGNLGQPADAASRPVPEQAMARERAVIDAAVEQFFREARPYLIGRTIFVVDGQRTAPPTDPRQDPFQRAYLIERLAARGAEVVDMEPIYLAHARSSPLSLEVGPYDGHLNRLGVKLATMVVAERLGR